MTIQVNNLQELPLPSTAQVIADIIGRDATLLLASKARHRAVYVPIKISDSHWLIHTLGKEIALQLHREFKGMHVPIARCKALHNYKVKLSIVEAVKSGETYNSIAKRLGVSLRHVQQVISKMHKTKIGSSERGGERGHLPPQESPSARRKNER